MSASREATVKRKATALAVAVGLGGCPVRLLAAEAPRGAPLEVGDRVRVLTSVSANAITGEVIGIGAEGLRLRSSDRSLPFEVPLASVTRLERSLGKRSNAGKGALLGTVAGVGIGAAIATKAYGGSDCDGPCTPYAVIVAAAVTGAGALLGTIGGALIRTERWESVSPGRVAVAVVPRRRAVAVAMAVRF